MRTRLNEQTVPLVAMHPGELLRAKMQGITHQELGEKLLVSQPFLSALLHEKKKISLELALKLEDD